ncbi:hypothetical protein [Rahnella sikkimica]|uniref:Uncharacterized protein n=1 Tax=Rahnella sikkimica TaxID=1805933 RepID=A0A2L1USN5_9GAMM|nr:hypothetical protein [Rahnella sikkimica]AVF35884.1 hypothetical protein BV494_13510 [Rahnella sikkimica]
MSVYTDIQRHQERRKIDCIFYYKDLTQSTGKPITAKWNCGYAKRFWKGGRTNFYCKKNLHDFNEAKKTGRIKHFKEQHNQPLLLQPGLQ